MVTDLAGDWEGREANAFEPEVRKPCLLSTEATTHAPGKGKWRQEQVRAVGSAFLKDQRSIETSESSLDALDLSREDRGLFLFWVQPVRTISVRRCAFVIAMRLR